MKRALVLMAAAVLVASVAMAAPDPWRVKVVDYDPLAPHTLAWYGDAILDSSVGSWNASGGLFRIFYGGSRVASYNATTGALAIGTNTPANAPIGNIVVVTPGSAYKKWDWEGVNYNGHDIWYRTSTDGITWSDPTENTIYGPVDQATGAYGHNPYVSTGGVYLAQHRDSGAGYQNAGGKGVSTTGVGETEWWDIDTQPPSMGYPCVYGENKGDPIAEPHSGVFYYQDSNNYGRVTMFCDGNLGTTQGVMNEYTVAGGYPTITAKGGGLNVGTAGEFCGGDHYIWLSDPDNSDTGVGVQSSLLSAIGLDGLSGPSLRTDLQTWWTGWKTKTLPIGTGAAMNKPASQFLLLYSAAYDTDSSGALRRVWPRPCQDAGDQEQGRPEL